MTHRLATCLFALAACTGQDRAPSDAKSVELLNVSYDPTRELYADLNTAFAKAYKAKTNVSVTIKQSHGGSGKQARSVIDGLEADVVSLALATDVDADLEGGTHQSCVGARAAEPCGAVHVDDRLPRSQGEPEGHQGLGGPRQARNPVITPNPKTSGGARWAYLAAWSFAQKTLGGDAAAQTFVKQLYTNVPVLDTGARGSTTTFVERGIGDVLLSWENEAYLASEQAGAGTLEIVVPPRSILAEPPVSIVDKVAAKHGTTAVATAYLEFLYTEEGQAIIAKHHYRPRSAAALASAHLPALELVTIDELGGWAKAQATHFADGGTFDQIYAK